MAVRDTVQDIIINDFETGGKSCIKNPATELSLIAIRGNDFTEIARHHVVFLPYDVNLVYEQEALDITNMSMEYIHEHGVEIKQALKGIYDFLVKVSAGKSAGFLPMLSMQNGGFDIGFWQQIFSYGKYNLSKVVAGYKDFYGNFQPTIIDSLPLARSYWAKDAEVTDFKQGKISDRLNIELVDAHRAVGDCLALREIVAFFLTSMRNGGNGVQSESQQAVKIRDVEGYKI
jgi:DNA polymerase III alpha subunit (gram-positive type)